MVLYFISSAKTNNREKNRKKREKGKRPTHLGPQAQLTCTAAQVRQALVVFQRSSKHLGGGHAVATDATPTSFLLPRRPPRVQEKPLDVLVTLPLSPHSLALSGRFPQILREQPPFVDARTRSQRWR